ncbi:MAG: flagellar biosynthesis protein FlhB [Magnetococcales bacterium]|nr:flagellar biosynthesis protein FlhB [Magnetococcales bacterium]
MAEDSDDDARTEEPTSKRLEEARSRGQVISSKEVSTALLLLSAYLLFVYQGEKLWHALQSKMVFFLRIPIQSDITSTGVTVLLRDVVIEVFMDLLPFFAVFVLMAFVGAFIQHGWLFTWQTIAPSFSKINPLEGVKRLFSIRSVVEAFKSLLKMGVISIAVYLALRDDALTVINLTATTFQNVVEFLASDSMDVLWRVTLAFIFLALLDFIYQRYDYYKSLRMTKQEVKDEYKQMEGDPQIKGRIRQLQRDMANRRMMQEVPKADVVITNPTHYSVAIKYVPKEMNAPKVVAKGMGEIALRIRELAKENNVPLVEDPPLARTIYREVELEKFIPPDLFKAVAQVLAYVYKLKRKK